MGRARGKALVERSGAIFADDDIEHYFSSSMYLDSSMPWPRTNTSIRPMPPNSLKLTQVSVGKLKAITRLSTPMIAKKAIHDRLTLFHTGSGSVSCSPSTDFIGFFFRISALKARLTENT